MTKHVKRSVIPIYLVGVIWLAYGLLLPLRGLGSYLLCAVLSVLGYVAGRAVFPDKAYELPSQADEKQEPEKPKSSGNPEIDKLIAERDRALGEMRRLNQAISDARISGQIDHLEEVTRKIIDLVVEQPQKLPQIRKFMSYYLPTTLKLLNAYDRMDSTGISGQNINATKQKVEDMMDNIAHAFDRQLDALYGEEALDISTDITVMEQMLQAEGLGGMTMGGEDEINLEL